MQMLVFIILINNFRMYFFNPIFNIDLVKKIINNNENSEINLGLLDSGIHNEFLDNDH